MKIVACKIKVGVWLCLLDSKFWVWINFVTFKMLFYHVLYMKVKTAWSSEMLVSSNHTTWHNNLENHKFYLHHNGNLKSCIRFLIVPPVSPDGCLKIDQVHQLSSHDFWVLHGGDVLMFQVDFFWVVTPCSVVAYYSVTTQKTLTWNFQVHTLSPFTINLLYQSVLYSVCSWKQY
jgi:hypothetical protein